MTDKPYSLSSMTPTAARNYHADILRRVLPVFTATTISAEPPWHAVQQRQYVRNWGLLGCTVYAINLSADFRSSFCLCRRTYRTTHSSLTAVMKNPRILCYVPEFDIFYTVFLNPASFVPRFEIKILFLYQFRLQRTLSLTSLFEKRRHSHGFLGGQNHSVNSRY
jgi:hypothetical protein